MSIFFYFGHTCDDGKDCDECDQISENKTECEHESNGLMYTSMPPQFKCIKCGEFYR